MKTTIKHVDGVKSLLLLFACILFTNSNAQINSQLETDLQTTLNNCNSSFNIEGVELAVIFPTGCSWTSTAGVRAPGTPIDITRKWSFGSCTKAITSAVTLQLHEEGVIDITDPIGWYIDADTILYVDSAITIQQLLTHTSGISEIWENGSQLWGEVWANRDSVWNFRDVFRDVYMNPPLGSTAYDYSGTNFMLLGVIIENATGNTLQQEFQNRIFTPLGMTDSYLGVDGIDMNDLNGLYNGTSYSGALAHNSYYSTRGGSAYLVSKPLDYAKFLRAFHSGDLHNTSIYQDASTPVVGSLGFQGPNPCLGAFEQYYGYGTEILYHFPNATDTIKFFGHGGNGLGMTIGVHNPDANLTVVLSGNDLAELQGSMSIFFELLCTLMNNLDNNPCALSIEENNVQIEKELVKIVDAMGREVEEKPNTLLIYVYSDGSTEKVYKAE